MPTKREHEARTKILGKISRAPEGSRTSAGTPVCRLIVSKDAEGPASSPVLVGLYLKGELARRCLRGLGVGDLIEAVGDLGPMRERARLPEVLVGDVKLRERASGRAQAVGAGVGA